MPKISPCYHCERRHKLCHSDCEDYALYRKAVDEIANKKQNDIYNNYIVNLFRKKRRKKNEKNNIRREWKSD